MKFTPMTDKDIASSLLFPEGVYEAEVFEAFDNDANGKPLLTKNGNEKIDLQCKVYDANQKSRIVKCVLTTAFMKLFKHFCDVTNLQDKYNSGNLTAKDCLSVKTNFLVEIKIKEYVGNDGKDYCMNVISDFLPLNNKSYNKDTPFIDDIAF